MGTFGGSIWGGGQAGGLPTGLTAVKPLFYMALRLAHVTKVAQVGPSPDQLADCLQAAQLMIDQAQIRRPMIYSVRITDYVLGTGELYTLGPGGTLVSTTGTSIRPVQIEAARLILTTTGTPVYLTIHRGSFKEFADLAIQQIPGALPKFLYCDYAYPTANIYLVPQDMGGDKLELYDWQSLPSLATVDDQIALSTGYQDWFVNKLAIRLASMLGEKEAYVTDDTRLEARRAEAALQSRNTKSPRLKSDAPGGKRTGDFNYFSGSEA